MKPNSQIDKQKLLAKYIDPPKKKNTKSYESNILLRD